MGINKLSADAEGDLYRIWSYGFREFGEAEADKYCMAFFERFEQIANTPYLYQSVDYIRDGYRRSVCGVNSIYYRITGEKVEIMRVLG